MMWEECAGRIRDMGGRVLLGHPVEKCYQDNGEWRVTARGENGKSTSIVADHIISTTAIRDLSKMLEPAPREEALGAADALRYRDFLTVALIAKDRLFLPDNWIYIHDPTVKVGRVQNFKSWSLNWCLTQSFAATVSNTFVLKAMEYGEWKIKL